MDIYETVNMDGSSGSRGVRRRALFFLVVWVLSSSHADLQETETRYLDSLVRHFLDDWRITGASLAVSKNGTLLYNKGYGYAGHGAPVNESSLFRIASLSKTISSMTLMRLSEQHKLSLEDEVFGPFGILKDFELSRESAYWLKHVTVRHLMAHAAGWDRTLSGDVVFRSDLADRMNVSRPTNKHAMIQYALLQPLHFIPGTGTAYSNVGYLILGRVIEAASGRNYADCVKHFLRRVEVTDMEIGHTLKEQLNKNEVEYFYTPAWYRVPSVFNESLLVPPQYGGFYLEGFDSLGGWIGTSRDLVALLDGMDGGAYRQLINPFSLQLMTQRPRYYNGDKEWYGLGLSVSDSGLTWGHTGNLDGSSAVMFHDMSGYNYAMLTNHRTSTEELKDMVKFAIQSVPAWFNHSLLVKDESGDVISADRTRLVKLMIPESKLSKHVRALSLHHRLVSIDGFLIDRSTFFNTVWERMEKHSKLKWKAFFSLNSRSLRKYVREFKRNGYHMSHVDSYITHGKLTYSAIFVRRPWPHWVEYHGITLTEHQHRLQRMSRKGFRLVAQSLTEFRGSVYATALYDKVFYHKQFIRFGLTERHFRSLTVLQKVRRRALAYVKVYREHGMTRVSAIWRSPLPLTYDAELSLNRYAMLNKLVEMAKTNVHPLYISGYIKHGRPRFAGIWRKCDKPRHPCEL